MIASEFVRRTVSCSEAERRCLSFWLWFYADVTRSMSADEHRLSLSRRPKSADVCPKTNFFLSWCCAVPALWDHTCQGCLCCAASLDDAGGGCGGEVWRQSKSGHGTQGRTEGFWCGAEGSDRVSVMTLMVVLWSAIDQFTFLVGPSLRMSERPWCSKHASLPALIKRKIHEVGCPGASDHLGLPNGWLRLLRCSLSPFGAKWCHQM